MRESPVASEKIAVDHASRRPQARCSTRPSIGRALAGAGDPGRGSATIAAVRAAGAPLPMANIKQQEKRVRTAARQRLENLRYRSTVKTLTRRLEAAVTDGDGDRAASEHRSLVRWIDKAAARGALHPNAAARKKAQAAKLVSRP